jgi:ribonuclease-3
MSEEGPDHEKTFTVGVYVEDKLVGTGNGPSKQAAQVAAAATALHKYQK